MFLFAPVYAIVAISFTKAEVGIEYRTKKKWILYPIIALTILL
jgi:hypothetical protein